MVPYSGLSKSSLLGPLMHCNLQDGVVILCLRENHPNTKPTSIINTLLNPRGTGPYSAAQFEKSKPFGLTFPVELITCLIQQWNSSSCIVTGEAGLYGGQEQSREQWGKLQKVTLPARLPKILLLCGMTLLRNVFFNYRCKTAFLFVYNFLRAKWNC